MARGKVDFEDLRIGHGEAATREHQACISCTTSLHRGERLQSLDRDWIDLKRREAIAGLRYGIEGMRIGGVRRIIVPPHLGYGKAGVPSANIPPNAMLIFEVEVHELRATHPIPAKLKLARERKADGRRVK